MKRLYTFVILVAVIIIGYPNFISETTAQSGTWAVGETVALPHGKLIRSGPGFDFDWHTCVPEDNWLVLVIDGPRYADGLTWYDIDRRALDQLPTSGTGWVSTGGDVHPEYCSTDDGGDPGDDGGPGDGSNPNLTVICHVPTGNPDRAQTIVVPPEDVAAHVGRHGGDTLGPCPGDPNPLPNNPPGNTPPSLPPSAGGNPGGGNPGGGGNDRGNYEGWGASCEWDDSANNSDYVQVNSDATRLRIRNGAGTSNSVLGWVVAGDYYPLLQRENGWGLIQTTRGSGWIYLDYATISEDGCDETSIEWCSITPIDVGNFTLNPLQHELVFSSSVNFPLLQPYVYYKDNYIDTYWRPGEGDVTIVDLSSAYMADDGWHVGISSGWSELFTNDWFVESNWRIDYQCD